MTAVDVSTGAAVAANNVDAVGTVVPLSSTNDKEAYVGVSVAFEGVCIGAFANGAGESAAASALLPPRPPLRCAPPPRFALPQLPLTLPPPPRHRQAATNVALSRCRHLH